MPLLKTRASWDNLILAPSVQGAKGATCLTCGRVVDYEELVEGYPAEPEKGRPGSVICKYLVRHHGAEELRTFDMGSSNWDEYDLQSMVMRTNWFDPTAFEGLGLGKEVVNAADHDGEDQNDGYAKPRLVEK